MKGNERLVHYWQDISRYSLRDRILWIVVAVLSLVEVYTCAEKYHVAMPLILKPSQLRRSSRAWKLTEFQVWKPLQVARPTVYRRTNRG